MSEHDFVPTTAALAGRAMTFVPPKDGADAVSASRSATNA